MTLTLTYPERVAPAVASRLVSQLDREPPLMRVGWWDAARRSAGGRPGAAGGVR